MFEGKLHGNFSCVCEYPGCTVVYTSEKHSRYAKEGLRRHIIRKHGDERESVCVWRIKFDALRCARKEVYKSKTEEFNATVKAKYSLQGRIGQLPRNETPATHADSTQLDNTDNRDIALNAVAKNDCNEAQHF